MRAFLAIFFLLGGCQAQAAEWRPWLGDPYELEWRASLLGQEYARLSSGTHLRKYPSHDLFWSAALCGALPAFGLEMEVVQAHTRRQRGEVDHLTLTGRYVWLDDIAGDPLSVTTGLAVGYAFPKALQDPSSFHHGRKEAEGFLSIGKETARGEEWASRWWGMLGVGLADHGSPWLRFYASYEKRFWEWHEIQVFVHSLWGLGQKNLHPRYFHGYGSVQHRSVDMGFRYVRVWEYVGSASLEYSYRPYAQNFPIYTHHIAVQFFYPFGI